MRWGTTPRLNDVEDTDWAFAQLLAEIQGTFLVGQRLRIVPDVRVDVSDVRERYGYAGAVSKLLA